MKSDRCEFFFYSGASRRFRGGTGLYAPIPRLPAGACGISASIPCAASLSGRFSGKVRTFIVAGVQEKS
jgi:hypothetical protein